MLPKAESKKPEFFIIGAPKCGTTTLYSWLKKHPDIFMPESKEPHYFAQNLSDRYCRVRDDNSYRSLFFDADENQLCGEASVLYGFYPEAVKAILEFNPKAKIIFMLRHPIDMIVSYHGQLLVNLEEDQKDFEVAWRLSEVRKNGGKLPKTLQDLDLLDYPTMGALSKHMKNIIDIVPEDQRLFMLLDDMAANPEETHEKVLNFLGASNIKLESYQKENEAAAIRSSLMQRFIRSQARPAVFIKTIAKVFLSKKIREKLNKTKRQKKIFSEDFLQQLFTTFKDDIKYLENYFQKKLNSYYSRKN